MRHLIEPEGNRAAVRWLRENSKRPIAAMNLWSLLLAKLHYDSGDILLSRGEIAGEVDITPREVSSIMKELESIEAIKRQPEGREVTYSMSRKLFVVPLGKAQEDNRQKPVFRNRREQGGRSRWKLRRRALLPDTSTARAGGTLLDAGRRGGHEDTRESDFNALRRTAADAAASVWAHWRDRLFPDKRKEDD